MISDTVGRLRSTRNVEKQLIGAASSFWVFLVNISKLVQLSDTEVDAYPLCDPSIVYVPTNLFSQISRTNISRHLKGAVIIARSSNSPLSTRDNMIDTQPIGCCGRSPVKLQIRSLNYHLGNRIQLDFFKTKKNCRVEKRQWSCG